MILLRSSVKGKERGFHSLSAPATYWLTDAPLWIRSRVALRFADPVQAINRRVLAQKGIPSSVGSVESSEAGGSMVVSWGVAC